MFYPFSMQSNGSFNAWLEYAVFGLDRWLRQRQGVYEYTSHSSCIFRIQRAHAEINLTLSDGTHIVPGAPVLNLHLWNEHIPPIGQNGLSVAWGRQVSRAMQISLSELARYMATCNDLCPIIAVRADMRLGAVEQSAKLSRIVSHYGFEAVTPDAIQEDGALQRFGENIYLFLLVLATNPIAVGAPLLRRDHTLVYLSRRTLELRYGRTVEPTYPETFRLC